jgi:alpha-1,2-mannosyltransferase
LNELHTQGDSLARYEVAGITAFFVLAGLFGIWVEVHSAFQQVRRTDLADFLRAGWAVRTGNDPYQIVEEHGWHYNFPPLFAIALVPLADPPREANHAGMVPFPVSVALWYGLSLVLLGAAVHLMAGVLEKTSGQSGANRAPPSRRDWWRLRLLPIIVCVAPIGFTLSRGQVNLLLLFLLCAMIAAIVARRSGLAGLSLAAAACVKVFPLYLAIYPLWRRDWRFLGGLSAGLLMGLIVIPVAVFGVRRTTVYYAELNQAVFEPAVVGGPDRSRATELIDPSATDSQSFQTIIHNTLAWREQFTVKRRLRSHYISPGVRIAHWAIVALLTIITLAAARGQQDGDGFGQSALLSTLMIVMLLASPVCHLHYFAMSLPLVAVLCEAGAHDPAGYVGGRFAWLLAAYCVLNALPLFPGLEILHDLGMGMYAALALWFAGVTVLARWPRPVPPGLSA